MKRWITLVLTAGTAAFVAGTAFAHAANGAHPGVGGSAVSRTHASASAFDNSVTATFTPIVPCRIVDTRLGGGPLVGGQARSFAAAGGSTSFPAQGGTRGGCGIPFAATAIDVSLQAVNATGGGYLNETPFGAHFATASLLHYVAGQTIGSGATFPVNGDARAAFELRASAHRTDVLVDVVGYYVTPMTAFVSEAGDLLQGSRAVSSEKLDTGYYEVDFDRDVGDCAYTVSPSSGVLDAEVSERVTTDHGIEVFMINNDNDPVDDNFYVTVVC